VISCKPDDIGFGIYPLNKGAVFLIECQCLFDCLKVVDSCQVHIENHAGVVLREFPELQKLRGIYEEWLAEENQVHWQLQLQSLGLTI
jgi:hypothetical protein